MSVNWSAPERVRLTELYTGRHGPLMPDLAATLNREFAHIRPSRNEKSIKNKVDNLGLKRHPQRRAEIVALNHLAAPDKSPLREEGRPRAPEWVLPTNAFANVPAEVIRRENESPNHARTGRRPDPVYSPVGCALAAL